MSFFSSKESGILIMAINPDCAKRGKDDESSASDSGHPQVAL